MSELIVRRYRDEDRETVWELHNLALELVGAHAGNGDWDADLHDVPRVYLNDGGEFLVGEAGGAVVAMGAFRRRAADAVEITRMRVHPDWQRRGFGAAILRALESRAAAGGYRHARLDTTTKQDAAQRLYRQHGYAAVGRKRHGPFTVIEFAKELAAP